MARGEGSGSSEHPVAAERFREGVGTASPLEAEEPDAAERQAIADLVARDAEVRRHEAAHLAAAGGLARGGARFEYVKGPDGKMYAVGGEVQIQIRGGDDPEETIARAAQIRAAALAPADPSSQDLAVASRAAAMEAAARQQLGKERVDLAGGGDLSATAAARYQALQGRRGEGGFSAWA